MDNTYSLTPYNLINTAFPFLVVEIFLKLKISSAGHLYFTNSSSTYVCLARTRTVTSHNLLPYSSSMLTCYTFVSFLCQSDVLYLQLYLSNVLFDSEMKLFVKIIQKTYIPNYILLYGSPQKPQLNVILVIFLGFPSIQVLK